MSRRVLLICLVLLLTACAGAPDTATTVNQAQAAPTAEIPTAVVVATELPATIVPSPTTAPSATPLPSPTPLPSSTPTAEPTPTIDATPTTPSDATQVAPEAVSDTPNDLPQLDETAAPATPLPTAEGRVASATEPVRLQIAAIGLDEQPISVGLDERRVPVVPKHDVGWYNLGAMPGQGENVVMWGHVLRWKDSPNVAAPFARVKELLPGAMINITTSDGTVHRYRVTQQLQVAPSQVKYILPVGSERLTLVSCIGDKVIENGFVTKKFRLVTIAEPVT